MSLSNPRRRTQAVTRPDADDVGSALSLKTNMTLRKGATFHSPSTSRASSPAAEDFVPPSLPRRSQTFLDDVIDAHRRRAALIVDSVDKYLNLDDLPSPTSQGSSFRDESLPVPRGFLDAPIVDPAMAAKEKSAEESERRVLRPRHRRASRHHESDSGLGTSLASTHDKEPASLPTKKISAITRSAATSSTTMAKLPGLSTKAANRISEHVLRPLLAKPTLKEFRPIVLDVPRKIHDKEIICLRDLEKTLIFMAPERAKSAALYLDFCLTSIHCIQATVETFSEREQTRPGDRPYTNGYFIDLVDQINQYARELAAAKAKAGDDSAMELDRPDEIKLFGGIHENGRPAELVRVRKDGKAISMATGLPIDMDEDVKLPFALKRSLSEQLEDEEEIMRSMARRKKNATPEELAPKQCREPGCNKEFKRPCDLTKHEKTHSRPWKCPVKTCKYHEYGWPTEKEMDRHHNDKHSSAPAMYECKFKPCPYKSKRESNCKQHMEKAHGWTYVRTKTNGKTKSQAGSIAHATPQLVTMPTPSSNESIATPPEDHPSLFPPFHGTSLDFPAYASQEDFMSNFGHPPTLDFHEDMSPLDQSSPSEAASYGQFPVFHDGLELTVNNEDIYGAHAQVPTPDPALFNKLLADLPFPSAPAPILCQNQPMHLPAAHISPIGQGNAMLYTPNSMADVDEGFEDFPVGGNTMGNDFQLFPAESAVKAGYDNLFGEIPSAGLGFSQTASQDMFPTHMDWTTDYSQYQPHH